jgi:hypothetical protein
MPRNRVPAERPMHERGTPSSPCGHWLSVEPLTPPTRRTGRRARSSPGSRGLRPYVFWGAARVRAIIIAVEQRRRFAFRAGARVARLAGRSASRLTIKTSALAAPHGKDDHSVSSRPLDRGISQ